MSVNIFGMEVPIFVILGVVAAISFIIAFTSMLKTKSMRRKAQEAEERQRQEDIANGIEEAPSWTVAMNKSSEARDEVPVDLKNLDTSDKHPEGMEEFVIEEGYEFKEVHGSFGDDLHDEIEDGLESLDLYDDEDDYLIDDYEDDYSEVLDDSTEVFEEILDDTPKTETKIVEVEKTFEKEYHPEDIVSVIKAGDIILSRTVSKFAPRTIVETKIVKEEVEVEVIKDDEVIQVNDEIESSGPVGDVANPVSQAKKAAPRKRKRKKYKVPVAKDILERRKAREHHIETKDVRKSGLFKGKEQSESYFNITEWQRAYMIDLFENAYAQAFMYHYDDDLDFILNMIDYIDSNTEWKDMEEALGKEGLYTVNRSIFDRVIELFAKQGVKNLSNASLLLQALDAINGGYIGALDGDFDKGWMDETFTEVVDYVTLTRDEKAYMDLLHSTIATVPKPWSSIQSKFGIDEFYDFDQLIQASHEIYNTSEVEELTPETTRILIWYIIDHLDEVGLNPVRQTPLNSIDLSYIRALIVLNEKVTYGKFLRTVELTKADW